ncbi:hypothetical protein MMC26_006868 [Xylographa opegraphella]|nr:hypothetical protein [Xylographa opegraphella]
MKTLHHQPSGPISQHASPSRPLPTLAVKLYKWCGITKLPTVPEHPITVVCISDTHSSQPVVPEGDLLLHAGDLTQSGSFSELQDQLDWLNTQPHKYKVVIGGNHDLLLDPVFTDRFPERIYERPGSCRADLKWGNIIYLEKGSIKLDFVNGRSLNIFGSPLTPQFGNWAFQHPPIRDVWTNVIPKDTDILLTHGPPKCHLDLGGKGDPFLTKELWRTRPSLVVFGHLHAARGEELVVFDGIQASYDSIMMGEKGYLSLVGMALLSVYHKAVGHLGMGRGTSKSKPTRLINAAIVGDKVDMKPRDGIAVTL